jgi:large subunit ribosomal protein L3
MAHGIIGRKLGMSQVFGPSGARIPVTVIACGPCTVVKIKNKESDGYDALVLGFEEALPYPEDPALQKKPSKKRLDKARTGVFKKLNMTPKKVLREIRMSADDTSRYEVGTVLKADLFQAGERVDATGITIGRGFSGIMKKWHMKGSRQFTRGTHEVRRHGGAIGQHSWPARVFPNKHMAGQFGRSQRTTQNIQVVTASPRRNLLLLRGGVPGPTGGLLLIRHARKHELAKAAG